MLRHAVIGRKHIRDRQQIPAVDDKAVIVFRDVLSIEELKLVTALEIIGIIVTTELKLRERDTVQRLVIVERPGREELHLIRNDIVDKPFPCQSHHLTVRVDEGMAVGDMHVVPLELAEHITVSESTVPQRNDALRESHGLDIAVVNEHFFNNGFYAFRDHQVLVKRSHGIDGHRPVRKDQRLLVIRGEGAVNPGETVTA